jgi:hypothetical protein
MAVKKRDKAVPKRTKIQGSRVARERGFQPSERGERKAPKAGAIARAPVVDGVHVQAACDRWAPELQSVSADPPRAPIDVLLGEAVLVGLLYQAYWQPSAPGQTPEHPGFARWAAGTALHEHAGHELLELVTAVAQADARYTRANGSLAGSPFARAEAVLREIRTTLEFLFDDAEYTRDDEVLHQLLKQHRRPRSHHQLAAALHDYSHVAHDYLDRLKQLPAFDVALLDEALVLSGALRTRRMELAIARENSAAASWLAQRNQLLAVLRDRVGRIRRAAQRVFAAHPEIARKFASDYQRVRRKQARDKARAVETSG